MRSFRLEYLIVFAYFASSIVGVAICISYEKWKYESGCTKSAIPKWRQIPSVFPVLVISRDDRLRYTGTIVDYYHLKDYLSKLDSYSFCVPSGKVVELRVFEAMDDGLNDDSFEVQILPDGKQYIKATNTQKNADGVGSTSYSGWYVMDGNQFIPKYYASWNNNLERAIISTAPQVLFLNTILWFLGYIVYCFYKSHKTGRVSV